MTFKNYTIYITTSDDMPFAMRVLDKPVPVYIYLKYLTVNFMPYIVEYLKKGSLYAQASSSSDYVSTLG